jgi:SAM-dependent methyltransferase
MSLLKKYAHFFADAFRSLKYPYFEQQYVARLKKENSPKAPMEFFQGMNDGLFFWSLVHSQELGQIPTGFIPEKPSPYHRRNWTGDAGEWTFRQAFAFQKLVLAAARQHLPKASRDLRILDFGCGWGRILRFFLRDVSAENLYGCDCWPEIVEIAHRDNPWCDFSVVPTLPDASFSFAQQSLDIIYLYSVFSHLSAEAHLAWVDKFREAMSPGGLLIATTRDRRFLERLARKRISEKNRGMWTSMLATEAFPDIDQTLRDYDSGAFCYAPTGGGGPLAASFYGEAAVPEQWFRNNWRGFEILSVVPARGCIDQLTIVAKKL